MNYTEKQFQEILNNSTFSVTDNATKVSLFYDNKFFMLESSYCQDTDALFFTFYVGENESDISDSDYNKIVELSKQKIEEEKQGLRSAKEIRDTQESIDYNSGR